MKKFFMMFRNPVISIVAAIAAIGLLAFAGIGGVRAALRASEEYTSQISMEHIGITLLENGSPVAARNYNSQTKDGSWTGSASGTLLANMLREKPEDTQEQKLIFEKRYPEALAVQNSGAVNSYIRISIYRYWLDENGSKQNALKLDPGLIHLYLGEGDKEVDLDSAETNFNGWIKDTRAGTITRERTVLYYSSLVNAGDVTSPVVDHIAIDNSIATKVSAKQTGTTVTTTYDYEGKQFCLEVTADAIQEHNASDAMKSAWGIDPAQLGLHVNE